jgi:hypothetical protein
VEVSTDGTTYSVPTTFSAGTWNTATLSLTNGSTYTLKARATDNLGNVSSILDIDSFTVDRTAPTITGMTAPANATYGSGQNLDFVATMSEATTVDITNGTPRIALTIGSTTRYATYLSGTGTTSLTFRYITQSGDNDTDGIAVTSPVDLNGGTLRDSAGNDATLTFTPPTTTGVLVDTSAPTISSITFSNTGCASNLCGPTDVVNVDVTFSENVTPSSLAATIPVTIGGTTTYTAAYASQLSATVLRFTKTIAATGSGETGALSTPVNPTITLTDGTLQDSAGNTATLTSTLAAGSSGYTVDTIAPTGTVTPLSTSDTTPPLSGTLGETGLTVTVIVNGQGPYTAAVSGTTWTLADNTITPALAANTYNVILTITDAAGNGGADSTTNELTVTADCPTIGNVCSDGSIYAGVSPDGTKAMFTTIAANEHSGIAWNDGSNNSRDTSLANCGSSESTCRTGKSNSSTLATEDSSSAAGIQPHNAAQYCENLTAHGQTDWYLPAKDEMNVLYTNRTAIGGFVSGWYWSSSEIGIYHAWVQNLSIGGQYGVLDKYYSARVRCVRRVN